MDKNKNMEKKKIITIGFWIILCILLVFGLLGAIDPTDVANDTKFIKDDTSKILEFIGIIGSITLLIGFIVFDKIIKAEKIEEEIIKNIIDEEKMEIENIIEEKSEEANDINNKNEK